ncbi:MAG: ATP-binding protein [Dehalococcoidia bacterium]
MPAATGGSLSADLAEFYQGYGDDGDDEHGVGDPGCPVCHGAGFVRRSVAFGHPDFGRAVSCVCVTNERDDERQDRLHRYSHMGSLVRQTFATLLPRGRSPEPSHQERFARALADAQRFAEQPDGWLLLLGESGTGKTHIAAAIANRCIERGEPVFFSVVPDLLDHLRAAYGPASEVPYDRLFDTVRNAPLLVLDSLGTQFSTPWAEEKLFQVINHRYNSRLPMVFTSATAIEDLDERLRTRLSDPSLTRIHMLEDGPGRSRGLPDPLTLPLVRGMTFATFDLKPSLPGVTPQVHRNLQNVYFAAQKFAEQPEGWLVLLGTNGSGKTHLAAAIAHHLREKRQSVRFVVVPDLLDYLRQSLRRDDNGSRDPVEEVRTAPFLVLDDLGVHSATPWAQEKLFQILNYRYNAKLATVITVSCSLEELPQPWLSRMSDSKVGDIHQIQAPDFRWAQRGQLPEPPRRGRR